MTQRLTASIALIGILAMTGPAAPARALERGEVVIAHRDRAYSVDVEIACTAPERAFGLMERDALADNAGMLFLYSRAQPADHGFWMYRTRLPLDIAFLDADGTIRAIRTMTPCTRDPAGHCPSYKPDRPYRAALEVNAGYFARRAIRVGDCVMLPGLIAGCRR